MTMTTTKVEGLFEERRKKSGGRKKWMGKCHQQIDSDRIK